MLTKFQVWYIASVPVILVGYDDNGVLTSIPYDSTDEDMAWEDLEDIVEIKNGWLYSKHGNPFGDNDTVYYFEAGVGVQS